MTILIIGKKNLAQALGVGHNQIRALVENEGLPAWQDGGRKVWKALPDEVAAWCKARRRKNLRRARQAARRVPRPSRVRPEAAPDGA